MEYIFDSIAFISQPLKERPLLIAITEKREKLTSFLDTGSPYSLMDEFTHSHLFSSSPIVRSSVNLQGLGKGGLQNIGETVISFYLGNTRIKDTFIVVRNIQMHPIILLGHSLMRKHKIIWDPANDWALVNGNKVKKGHTLNVTNCITEETREVEDRRDSMRKTENSTEDPTIISLLENKAVNIQLDEDMEVPPRSSIFARVRIKKKFANQDVLVEDLRSNINGISVTDSLVRTDIQGKCLIEVTNTCHKVMEIESGTLLCSGEIYQHEIVDVATVQEKKKEIYDAESSSTILRDIKEKLQKDIKDEKVRECFQQLLYKYKDCFATEGAELGLAPNFECKIQLTDPKKPIYIPSYRLPAKHKEEVDRQVAEMLKQGVIETSKSLYNFPILLVPKKEGSWRLCVDFRKLNAVTVPDRFPAQCVDDVINSFGDSDFFTSIDLVKGYYQIRLSEDSKEYTAFSTSTGHYHFKRLPFGLRNAPVVFIRLIRQIFGDLLGSTLEAYMDDLVVSSKDLQEHLRKLDLVFSRLRENNLKVKLSKCDFYQSQLGFLGFLVCKEGLRVVPTKVKAIADFPVPTSVKSLQTFLGMVGYYRRFLYQFATIAAPLTDLLRKDSPFVWTDAQQNAFELLKKALQNPPILVFPNYNEPFTLITDASDTGIGGVLMQKRNGKFHPLGFYSRKLRSQNPNEQAYPVIDRECLAIVQSLISFKYIIYGCTITVFTDHLPLVSFFKSSQLTAKRIRWALILEDFGAVVKYIPGRFNTVADSLSRNSLEDEPFSTKKLDNAMLAIDVPDLQSEDNDDQEVTHESTETEQVLPSFLWDYARIRSSQVREKGLARIINRLESKKSSPNTVPQDEKHVLKNGVLCRISLYKKGVNGPEFREQVLVPHDLRGEVLKYLHVSNAHPGVRQMIARAQRYFFWPGLRRDISRLVKECQTCNTAKGVAEQGKVFRYPVPERPLDRVHIDILSGFCETNRGNKHLLVCVDALTRYTAAIPLRNKTAVETATAFFKYFVCQYGIPRCLISDSGLEFRNKFLTALCQQLNVNHSTVVTYHPASNGLVERANRKLLDVLRITVGNNDANWDEAIPQCLWVINTTPHRYLHTCPFEAIFGFVPNSVLDVKWNLTEVPEPLQFELQAADSRFKLLQARMSEMDITEKKVEGDSYVPTREVGDMVYIRKNVRRGLNYKLDRFFEGPYKIVRILRAGRIVVEKNGATKTVTEDQLRK